MIHVFQDWKKNPMRILDCKSPVCSEIAKDAPSILDYLCEESSAHFEKLKFYLDNLDIKYTVDPKIVRGLDYYTKTVFEFVTTDIGAQGTICGGGRYDGLIEQMGGQKNSRFRFCYGTGTSDPYYGKSGNIFLLRTWDAVFTLHLWTNPQYLIL